MSGYIVSKGRARRISIRGTTLERVARLLGITAQELRQGHAVHILSRPKPPKKPKAKRKSARRE
jgi:hypothetical protein